MNIREATKQDFEAIWPIFREIVKAGDTYGYSKGTTKEQAEKIWLDTPGKTYVFEQGGHILGTYYLKTNQAGPGIMFVIVATWSLQKPGVKAWQLQCVGILKTLPAS